MEASDVLSRGLLALDLSLWVHHFGVVLMIVVQGVFPHRSVFNDFSFAYWSKRISRLFNVVSLVCVGLVFCLFSIKVLADIDDAKGEGRDDDFKYLQL